MGEREREGVTELMERLTKRVDGIAVQQVKSVGQLRTQSKLGTAVPEEVAHD